MAITKGIANQTPRRVSREVPSPANPRHLWDSWVNSNLKSKDTVKIFLLIVLKSAIEFYFLHKAKNLFSGFSYLKFLALQPFHIVYIILAGWLGYFKKYEWKGRKVH